MPRTGPAPRLHRGRGRAAAAQVPCPHCGYPYSRQISTKATEDGYQRKRVCLRAPGGPEPCDRQFVTYEILAREIKLVKDIRKLVTEAAK